MTRPTYSEIWNTQVLEFPTRDERDAYIKGFNAWAKTLPKMAGAIGGRDGDVWLAKFLGVSLKQKPAAVVDKGPGLVMTYDGAPLEDAFRPGRVFPYLDAVERTEVKRRFSRFIAREGHAMTISAERCKDSPAYYRLTVSGVYGEPEDVI